MTQPSKPLEIEFSTANKVDQDIVVYRAFEKTHNLEYHIHYPAESTAEEFMKPIFLGNAKEAFEKKIKEIKNNG